MKDGAEANELVTAINHMLAGRSAAVQGAALAGMMAIHLVRFMPVEMRPGVVESWLETMWQLVDIIEKNDERQRLQ